MVRKYNFKSRRRNPTMFPYFCEICKPQRRFAKTFDKGMHDSMKHGEAIGTTSTLYSRDLNLPTYSSSQSTQAYSSSYSLSTISANELQTFATNEIEPDTAYNSSCKAVVHRLCFFMQNNFPDEMRPSEVIKSGSLGKGTAVKGKSDADLVVFLSSFHSISQLYASLPSILQRMKLYLDKYGHCTIEKTTSHAVKVSLSCHAGHTHDVDILPSVNILSKNSKTAIYSTMKSESPKMREYYSAALAPLQISFVSNIPTKVKTLIRLIKYWRKTFFEESSSRSLPTSYPLELITIGEWGDAGRPQNFDLRKGFYHVLRAIANYTKLKHAWNTNYNFDNFKCYDSYYVMDPANPFNNVMKKCDCWSMVAEKTNQFLTKPLFYGLSGYDGWN
ncbi:2'-5'-oligoadenylate synthase 3-like [Saccostrea cucullata]|uniref:2'-5'-oligoadenylate synthase 3-like n=1 Tax=Saccostrea cuccullata TaxID=36930 RepID=UPI002ED18623